MRTVCYLRVERSGETDVKEIDSILDPLSLEHRRREHDGSPIQSIPLEYWVTRRFESESEVAPGFVDDVMLAAVALRDSGLVGKISITAVVARYFAEGEAPAGLYLNRTLLAALAEIDADVDIDAVPMI